MRGHRPDHGGAALTPRPWWFGPESLPEPVPGTPFDLVLLDRDDTLNVRVPDGYVTRPDDLEMLPGAVEAVGLLTRAGCRTALVTNQRGIARGLMTEADLVAVHERLDAALAAGGGRLDAVAVCPHDVGECRCRKPEDGLFREVLARAAWADPRRSVMIGDSPGDLEPAQGLGIRVERVDAGRDLLAVVTYLLG